jgi:hypothetical protein
MNDKMAFFVYYDIFMLAVVFLLFFSSIILVRYKVTTATILCLIGSLFQFSIGVDSLLSNLVGFSYLNRFIHNHGSVETAGYILNSGFLVFALGFTILTFMIFKGTLHEESK